MNAPLIVLGAGPAGLAAAEAASASGQAVLLVDENGAPGGQIWRGGPQRWRDARAAALWDALRARPHVSFMAGARVVAPAGPQALLLETADGALAQPWNKVIVCSGARELLLPFPGWTLPGVTGAGGLQALVKGGMPLAGKRVLVAGTGPLLLAVAATVCEHGGEVVAVAEHRASADLARFGARLALSHRGKLLQSVQMAARLRGVPYLRGAALLAAEGRGRLERVLLRHRGREQAVDCDFLACGFGLVPSLELAALFGCVVEQGRVAVDAAQRSSAPGVWAAGESTGIGGVDKALAEGRIAGLDAVGLAPHARDLRSRGKAQAFGALLAQAFAPLPSLRRLCTASTIVCRCEDVVAADLAPHAGWRSAKLQTRAGMGPCQGRVCGSACAFLYGWEAPGLRQPVFPACAATLALARTERVDTVARAHPESRQQRTS
ncbi:NAD(P)/FAD-dependent oxidoreductase [Massilia atriviolacea]|uniref:NAD(P)/FAD-dependent oxidoreductase n=1 Tax=Massilia atriviolacea TaxID=2495579 RepID=A0A430HND0_9BURK|nr:FAD/NAD(P)-binding oxidoreductase [Massilia atriviolacea]RSZ59013.1 NAD(P)/FAD-dependent oxidoreductase [Massilia atriviolacea]